MSLKDEFEKIIDAQCRGTVDLVQPGEVPESNQKVRLDEVRPLLTEFAEAVDEAHVRVRVSDSRVVIDVGETPSDVDSFEIDGRWELEPNPEVRFLAEPGAEHLRPKSSFVVWKTLYLRPLMEPENLSWDRMEFDSGVEAFQFVFQDVAKQIARQRRLEQAGHRAEIGPPAAT